MSVRFRKWIRDVRGMASCGRPIGPDAFTLVEVMVAAAVFVMAFTGLFMAYGQSTRILDSLRQSSRAEDIALANVEFLKTRSWSVLTNQYTTTSSSTPPQWSTNMTESINQVLINGVYESPVCSHLEIQSGDPMRIDLRNVKRDLIFSPATCSSSTESLTVTVLISWDSLQGTQLTNSLTTIIAKGGMSADVF